LPRLANRLRSTWIDAVFRLLPRAFREQNVSRASVGELHAWMYDAHSLGELLVQAGFSHISQRSATDSSDPHFPTMPLDATADGQARKGQQSLYLEARA
jgi:hypothetical protein